MTKKKCMFGKKKDRCKRPQPTIHVVGGVAKYVKTEIEDKFGRWSQNFWTRDGYWVLHEGKKHHIYKM